MNEAISQAKFNRDSVFNEQVLTHRKWVLNACAYPNIDCTFHDAERAPLRLHLHCNNWDAEPPSIDLLDEGGTFLQNIPPWGGIFHAGPHPITGRPFICMRGTLEYHTHPSHLTDHWDNYRGKSGNDLAGLLSQIWSAWRKVRP